jgi:hypothetical protein
MKKTTKDTKINAIQKTEVVTLRIDPKIRFGLELLSRKQYRNLSSVVEWAINEALNGEDGIDNLNFIWDVEEADRFINLALYYPELLSYEEQILWKLLSGNGYLWKGQYDKEKEWIWACNPSTPIFERIRKHFNIFKDVAAGKESPDKLPHWDRKKSDDDEIPF